MEKVEKQVLKILLLEDSQRDSEIISELLIDEGFNLIIERVDNSKEFISSLRSQKYDVILSDFSLPDFNAFGALKHALELCPETPFIVVSGSIGEETAIDLIKKGAIDYVLKDRIERLPFSVKRALEEVEVIEARKQVEKALKNSEMEYRGLFENAPLGIYRTTPDGRIIKANPFLVKMLGYRSFKDLVKRNLNHEDFEPSYSREEFQKRIEQNGEIRGLEAQWKLHNGTVIYVSESATLVRDENKKPLYYDGIVEDISGRKSAEAEIQKRIEDLEYFHKFTVGRELTMIELKREINSLLKEAGKEQKYLLVE
jgi:PAS domain S-box